MKQYKLVIKDSKRGHFFAFYCELGEETVYDFKRPFVSDKTVRGVLKKAKEIKPDDGEVMYTYLDRINR